MNNTNDNPALPGPECESDSDSSSEDGSDSDADDDGSSVNTDSSENRGMDVIESEQQEAPAEESTSSAPIAGFNTTAAEEVEPSSSPEEIEQDAELARGMQSSRNVILTGFLHGTDSDKVKNEYNYNRYERIHINLFHTYTRKL